MKILNTNKYGATIKFENYEIGQLKAMLISLEELVSRNNPINLIFTNMKEYDEYVAVLHMIQNYRDKFIHTQELIKEANDTN